MRTLEGAGSGDGEREVERLAVKEKVMSVDPKGFLTDLRKSFYGESGDALDKCRGVLTDEQYQALCGLVFIDVFHEPDEHDTARANELAARFRWRERLLEREDR